MVVQVVLAELFSVDITALVPPASRVVCRITAGGPADGTAVVCMPVLVGACSRMATSRTDSSLPARAVLLGSLVRGGMWIDYHTFARVRVR